MHTTIADNPEHVQNLNSITKLKAAGFIGIDASLIESLHEYGLAWKDLGEEVLFVYKNEHGSFDRCIMKKDIDVKKEFNWVDWDQFFGSNDFNGLFFDFPLSEKITSLFMHYGTQEIFGTTYWEGFQIEGLGESEE